MALEDLVVRLSDGSWRGSLIQGPIENPRGRRGQSRQRAKVNKQAGFCFRDRCGTEESEMLRQTSFSILLCSLRTP